MPHNIPTQLIDNKTKGISDAKRTQVADLQNYIQGLLTGHYTFLQGSYKNDTSPSDINDVDIVAVRSETFSGVFSGQNHPVKIDWNTIFSDVFQKLNVPNPYNWKIVKDDKCLKIITSTFKADVVPAVKISLEATDDPIAIYSFRKGQEKQNWPRTHWQNGISKHQGTSQRYKPVVRMFKNWVANHFGDNAPISSYQIESLVHSTPNNYFQNDHAESFINVSAHIINLLDQNTQVLSVCGRENIFANWQVGDRSLFRNKLYESNINARTAYSAQTVQGAQQFWNRAFNI